MSNLCKKNEQFTNEETHMNIFNSLVAHLSMLLLGCLILTACNTAQEVQQTTYDLTKGPAPSEPTVPEGMVELLLKDKLDGDLSNYCVDIVGGGPNINPANGLQTHTCYSYRGSLGSDQAIDPDLFSQGVIKMTAFDVCAAVANLVQGSKISLEDCRSSPAQEFVISTEGTISPTEAPDLCFTVGEETKFGRGGTSPHQIKSLTLEPCNPALARRQEWRTRKQGD